MKYRLYKKNIFYTVSTIQANSIEAARVIADKKLEEGELNGKEVYEMADSFIDCIDLVE